ncbi:MAG TPA: site-specific DNA-methyltransferase, partial [Longimicrobium sp.]
MPQSSPLPQLQSLLRELFQLDLSDLDFGLYRVLRRKRDDIEAFLNEQLPRRVGEAFREASAEERERLQARLDAQADRIRTSLGAAALQDGEIAPHFAGTPMAEEYEAIRIQLADVRASEAQQAEVFNHLLQFFSRYYDAGDFMPRRRYGASREHFAVPYNGEETFFHWANRGQHYVKSGELFRDYAFVADAGLLGEFRVRFVLRQATVAPGNTKGEARFFFPLPHEAEWRPGERVFILPFHYRLPTAEEQARFGKNGRAQEVILADAFPRIVDAATDPALKGALEAAPAAVEGAAQEPPYLMRRLRHFTRRSTSDYFVHRNLRRFLERELEFYVKDQVLHLGDLEADLPAKLRVLRTVRRLAGELTEFLAELEEVQRRLFEKRKLVLRTDWLALIKDVPRALWPEVLGSEAQVEAWRELFAIDPAKDLFNPGGELNERFLDEHPTLVVNTRHFTGDFVDRLLEGFDGNIDEATGGVLINSENYQALRLLQRSYAGRVKCIYIDPPYNTGSDDFIYKDRYQHSSWLTMMQERLLLARSLLTDDGVLFVSIDDNEYTRLWPLLKDVFGENYLASFVWKRRSSSALRAAPVSVDHEYVLVFAKDVARAKLYGLSKGVEGYPYADGERRYASTDLTVGMTAEQRPGQFYSIQNPRTGKEYPGNPQRVWRFFPDTMARVIADDLVIWPDEVDSGMSRPRYKTYYDPEDSKPKPVSSWIDTSSTNDRELREDENEYDLHILTSGMNQEGGRVLDAVLGARAFAYPKPVSLIRSLIRAATRDGDIVIDFFAGSGTTGHAVLNLNQEDGGARHVVLVESGDYFSSALVPRIERVLHAPKWRDGLPAVLPSVDEVARTPRLVKILRLESYEDALHNLCADDTIRREEPRADAFRKTVGADAYRIRYMAGLSMDASASMLQLEGVDHPFGYTIETLGEDGPRVEPVDLIETFNLVYGLRVERRERWTNPADGRLYRTVQGRGHDDRRVLVLWRDVDGLDTATERAWLE